MEYINLNNLRAFYYVAKHESFSEAARELLVQQPALSKNVKALEDELAMTLYQRVGRGIELTDEGRYIFGRASEIFEQVSKIINFSKDQDIPLKETINIALSDAISGLLAPKILKDLNFSHPSIRPVISTGKSSELLELIKRDKIEFGALFHLPKSFTGAWVVERIPLEFRLVIDSNQYHSERVKTSFIGSREVDDPENIRFPTVEIMKRYWPETQIRYSSNSLLGHLEMVRAGIGVAILPLFMVREELRKGTLRELLIDESFVFDLKIVKKNKAQLSEYSKGFIAHLKRDLNL